MGIDRMRLFKLLAVLGFGFLVIAGLNSGKEDPRRLGLTRADAPIEAAPEVTRAPPADALTALPAAVRRLAEAPVSGPLRPVVLGEAQPIPALAVQAPGAVTADIRRVGANRANVRSGPSTGHGIVGSLAQGEEVEVIGTGTDGWLHIRVQGDGVDGWVAARLIAPRL